VSVQVLSQVGDDCPDLLVGHNHKNFLFEIKRPKGQLTTGQKEWHGKWRGQVAVVKFLDDAIRIINGGKQ
jgi:hypothetical protein